MNLINEVKTTKSGLFSMQNDHYHGWQYTYWTDHVWYHRTNIFSAIKMRDELRYNKPKEANHYRIHLGRGLLDDEEY